MFRYANSNSLSKPKEPQNKIVTKIRQVTYIHDNGVVAQGFETVEELTLDPAKPQPPVEMVGHKTVYVALPKQKKEKNKIDSDGE
jgi:hypothetical protein